MKTIRSTLLVATAIGLLAACPVARSARAATSADASSSAHTVTMPVNLKSGPVSRFAPSLISGTGFSYRHNWGQRNGDLKLTLTSPFFTKNTRAFVSIGECDLTGGKFIGAAKYTLYNVAPNTGVVSIWVNINWGAPIWLCADYLFVNP